MDGQPKELESDKMLAQIEAAKSQSKQQKSDVVKSAQSPEVTPSQTSDKNAAVADNGTQAVSKDIKEDAPAEKADKQNIDVEIREWAKKKGLKDGDSALRSLRELEKKLHGNAYENKVKETTAPQWQPQPTFQPQMQPQFAPPPYYPPQYPMDREKILEQEASRRGWDKEDFRKVLDLADEVSDMKMRRIQAQNDARYAELSKETMRNSEIRELMNDPLFTNEKVQFEMHKVLEENPKAFTLEPMPYSYAFNEAQRRLARRYLQGGSVEKNDDSTNQLPTKPPQDGSRGTGPTFEQKDQKVINQFNAAKTSDEQKKILESLGAVKDW